MNVLHLVEYLNLGGIERLLEQIATYSKQALESEGLQANNSFFTYETAELKGIGLEMQKQGHKIYTFKKCPGRDWKLVSKLIEVIQAEKIDVLHTHDFGPMEYAVLLKIRFPKLKLIHTQHTLAHFLGNKKYLLSFQAASFFYSSIILVSDFVKNSILDKCSFINKASLRVIPNGVDLVKFKSTLVPQSFIEDQQSNHLRLVSISRISPVKNLDYLLQTCRLLKEAGVSFELHHAGSAKEKYIEEKYHKYIQEHKLDSCVKMHGFTDDASQILALGDIFVSSSLSEGHPVALLEAMAAEKYCIVSDILPHRETSHGALEFFNLSDPQALFEILQKKSQDQNFFKENALKVGSYARKVVAQNYSLNTMVEKYLEQYYE